MLFVLLVLGAVAVIVVMNARRGMTGRRHAVIIGTRRGIRARRHDAPIGWMSEQWLIELKSSRRS